MISCLPDYEIERFLDEDLPYGDLTTHLLGIGQQPGEICFTTRHETTLCCTEEAARLLEKCGCRITQLTPSGTTIPAGQKFLCAEGTAQALHAGLSLLKWPRCWKLVI